MPALQWDESTAYDLFVSLYVLHRPNQFGLRPARAAGVRSRLPAAQREFLEKVQAFLPVPLHWLYLQSAGARTAADALSALALLPPAERLPALTHSPEHSPQIIETLGNITRRQSWVPAELEVIRSHYQRRGISFNAQTLEHLAEAWAHPAEFGEAYLQALQTYYEVFFAEEEERIRPTLHRALERAQELAERLTPETLVEELSRGVHFAEFASLEEVILIPSFWTTPLVFYGRVRPNSLLILFGARTTEACLSPQQMAPEMLVDALKALADPSRLAILRLMSQSPRTPSELARLLRLRAPTVVHHLNILRLAGLVEITLLPGAERRYALREGALQTALDGLDDYIHSLSLPEE